MVGRPVTAPRSIPKFDPELFSPPRFFGDPEVASDNLQTMEARNWVAEVDVVNDEPLRRFRHLASLCWLGCLERLPADYCNLHFASLSLDFCKERPDVAPVQPSPTCSSRWLTEEPLLERREP